MWALVENNEVSKVFPKIDAVSDVDALAALYVYNDANPPVRPLGEFPTPPSS
jgi:hypothetical protein